MTNEGLATLAQGGDEDALLTLWGQVRRLAWKQMARWRWAAEQAGMTAKDCEQAALVALLLAVRSYDPGKGMFSTWFTVCLRREFIEAAGLRTEHQKADPLRAAVSLDAPVSPEMSEEITLAALIEDPAAEVPFQTAGLRADVAGILTELSAEQLAAVRARFWEVRPCDGKALSAALRYLRHPDRSRRLRGLL